MAIPESPFFLEYYTERGTMPSNLFKKTGEYTYNLLAAYNDNTVMTAEYLPILTDDEGYIFKGWYSTSTFEEGTKVEVGDTVGDFNGDYLYAKWSTPTVAYRMTNLANEIRTISGTTDLLSLAEMKDKVNEANTEIDAQALTIAEISELLEGKSVSGGGSTLEECDMTITIENDGFETRNFTIHYPSISDGSIIYCNNTVEDSGTINITTIKDHFIMIRGYYMGWPSYLGCEELAYESDTDGGFAIIKITDTTASIRWSYE